MSKETRYPNYTTFSYYIMYNTVKAIKVTVKIFRQSPTIKIAVKTFNHLPSKEGSTRDSALFDRG